MNKTSRVALALSATVLLLATGACAGASTRSGSGGSGGSSSSQADSASASGGLAKRMPAAADGFSTRADSLVRTSKTSAAVDPLDRAVISTGAITLHTSDLEQARTTVLTLVAGWGGTVADEQSSGDRQGRITDSTLKLRVPTAHFDEAMRELAQVGRVQQQTRSSKDVTTQVIDVDARVRAAKRSIRSIENLLSRATKLGDVITIENDLGERQANLDSLEQQQAWLDDQTSLSTITVSLSQPGAKPVHKADRAPGFLGGLGNGWHALGATVAVVATVLGAVLPFAVLALVLGVPLWWVVRRRRPLTPPAAEAS